MNKKIGRNVKILKRNEINVTGSILPTHIAKGVCVTCICSSFQPLRFHIIKLFIKLTTANTSTVC